ncbi:MAG: helix-turn-helix transcriptional regulator [Methanobrevibacter sp.]|nr:helix-turn-helix transcriptional regulator [Methanobrevibacter sp.]
MAKKIILALAVIAVIVILAIFMINNNTVAVFNDGENITVETHSLANANIDRFNEEVCDLTMNVMNETESNITTLKEGIAVLCEKYGIDDAEISIDSSIGPDQIPVLVHVDGTSMLPTLKDGQSVLINKTHDVHVGDIVVAESDEYGGIIKRVDNIQGNSVHLISDNKNIAYEYLNGQLYEIKGITTWVDVSDINGVVIDY